MTTRRFQNPSRFTAGVNLMTRKGLEYLQEAFDAVYSNLSRALDDLNDRDGNLLTLLFRDQDKQQVTLTEQATNGLRFEALAADPTNPDAKGKNEAVLWLERDERFLTAKIERRDATLEGQFSTISKEYIGGRIRSNHPGFVTPTTSPRTVTTVGAGGSIGLHDLQPNHWMWPQGDRDFIEFVYQAKIVTKGSDVFFILLGPVVMLSRAFGANNRNLLVRGWIRRSSASTAQVMVEYIESNPATGNVTIHQVTRPAAIGIDWTSSTLTLRRMGAFLSNTVAGTTVISDNFHATFHKVVPTTEGVVQTA